MSVIESSSEQSLEMELEPAARRTGTPADSRPSHADLSPDAPPGFGDIHVSSS